MKIFVPNWKGWEADIKNLEKYTIIHDTTPISEPNEKSQGGNTNENRKDDEIKVKLNENGRCSIYFETEFKTALEILADAGYEYAVLNPEILRRDEKMKSTFPSISSIDGVHDLPDFETLKSLIRKAKSAKGVDECGAIGTFVGIVRKNSDGKEVTRLEYEINNDIFYIKLKEIEKILKKYPNIADVRIHHNSGNLYPGEDIVYVVVLGGHRHDIWPPLKESMELIKKELPIWKKEVYLDGEAWMHDNQWR